MGQVLNSGLLGICLWLVYYVWSYLKERSLAYQHGCEPPTKYPHKDFIFGLDYAIGSHFDIPSIARCHDKYGKTFQTRFMTSIHINTSDPQNVNSILGPNNKDWGVEPLRLPGMEPFCGSGILTADGAMWQHSRTLLKPVFSRPGVVDFPTLELALDELFSRIPSDGSTVDLQPLFYNLFLHTATHFLLGFSALSLEEESNSIYGNVGMFISDFHDAMFQCGLRVILGRLRFLIPKAKLKKSSRSSHQFLDYYIDKTFTQKLSEDTYQGSPETKSQSLLEGLVEQTNDRVEIRNQTLQGLMAASDTISILLSNTLFLLSRHPSIWKQLRQEILSFTPATPTFESLNTPGLLRNIIYESLRLFPVFPLLGRVSRKDTKLLAGGGSKGRSPIFVPTGTRVDICFYALYRDRSVFGPDVEDFVPSRWDFVRPSHWEFLPFGRGPRACMGQQKALLEAYHVIIKIAQKFERLESRDSRPYKAEMKLTCRNANGCKIALFEK